jgi:hypothetical protein
LIVSEFSANLCVVNLRKNRMPIIRSISSLRNRTREIATICHDQDELFQQLGVAQARSAAGKKTITHKQMMTRLRRRINAR